MPRRSKTSASQMTTQEEAFAQHFALHGKGRAAYLHAFPHSRKWKPATVDSRASNLLATGKIQARLTILALKVQAVAERKFEITAERILQEYAAIAFTKVTDFARWGKKKVIRHHRAGKDESGNTKYVEKEVEVDYLEYTPSDQLSEVQAKAIAVPEKGMDKFGNEYISLKMHDRMKALEKLGQYVGLFTGKVEHTHKGNVVSTIEIREIEDVDDPKTALKIFEAYRLSVGSGTAGNA